MYRPGADTLRLARPELVEGRARSGQARVRPYDFGGRPRPRRAVADPTGAGGAARVALGAVDVGRRRAAARPVAPPRLHADQRARCVRWVDVGVRLRLSHRPRAADVRETRGATGWPLGSDAAGDAAWETAGTA